MSRKRSPDWVAEKMAIADSRNRHWTEVAAQYPTPEAQLKVLRQRKNQSPALSPDAKALRGLVSEVRFDIALARAQRLLTSPIEQRQGVQDANL